MTKYAFNDREIAETLVDIAMRDGKYDQPARQGSVRSPHQTLYGSGWYVKTPAAGIPARVGDVLGKAECTLYYIDPDDERNEWITPKGSNVETWVWNETETPIPGDTYRYADSLYGKPVIHSASSMLGARVEFEIDAPSSSSGSSSEAAGSSSDDRACGGDSEYEGKLRVKVVGRPCGVERVCGEDEEGYIEVIDREAGGFLRNRTDEEIEGMKGFAELLQYEEDGGGGSSSSSSSAFAPVGSSSSECGVCVWVITWMNWSKPRQAVQDVIERPTEITIELENRWYWNRCTLPDEVIDLVDCIEDAGGSSSSGAE